MLTASPNGKIYVWWQHSDPSQSTRTHFGLPQNMGGTLGDILYDNRSFCMMTPFILNDGLLCYGEHRACTTQWYKAGMLP